MPALDPAAAAVELHERAIALRESGDYAAAELACRGAVLLFEASEGEDSADLAHALVEQAQLLESSLDELPRAAALVERALAILHGITRDTDPADVEQDWVRLVIRAEVTSAAAWRARGEATAAERAGERALGWIEANPSRVDTSATVEVLAGLGVVYKLQGRFDEAEAVYRRAFALLEAAGEAGGDDAATLLHNLGGLAHSRGEFELGEVLARRALEQREQLLGRDHPIAAADRAAWAALLHGLGRLAEAEEAYGKALEVFEGRLGAQSLEVAAALLGRGGVRQARGAVEDAERDCRRALAIREAKLGPIHPDVALTLNDLALLCAKHHPAEALMAARRALAIFAARLGDSHPYTRAAAANVEALGKRP